MNRRLLVLFIIIFAWFVLDLPTDRFVRQPDPGHGLKVKAIRAGTAGSTAQPSLACRIHLGSCCRLIHPNFPC